jgi:hypothetical protein
MGQRRFSSSVCKRLDLKSKGSSIPSIKKESKSERQRKGPAAAVFCVRKIRVRPSEFEKFCELLDEPRFSTLLFLRRAALFLSS